MARLNIGSLVRVKYDATPPPPEWSQIFTENFENGWFISNAFNSVLTDNFEVNWFIDNLFNLLFTEDFEDPSWFE